jgi:hypothetical protein
MLPSTKQIKFLEDLAVFIYSHLPKPENEWFMDELRATKNPTKIVMAWIHKILKGDQYVK